ncbi:MAG TPA: family 43 glycosylhydrolase [Chitinispirillaceae bacterium]|nr:family 43 glycosylhydrolase [Chitinispirillaceae bacterium]
MSFTSDRRIKRLNALSFLLLCSSVISYADNPVVQTSYTADPAPLVYNGEVYMYVGEDSAKSGSSYLMPDWRCYSSADMVNWTDHGVVYSPKSVSWSTARDANASQVAYRNSKFYYYISTTASDGIAVGVAVSNSPIGPFKDTLGKPLVSGSKMTGCNATHSWRGLDPTIFVDDDEQAYLYWGNNVCYWTKINDDMISYSVSINCIAQNDPGFGPDYEEGPWFYKRNNLYYLIYPSKIPESMHYSTSTGPAGPWKYGGEIQPVQQGQGSSSTIHPGMIDFGGKSYYFYHNGALQGGGSYKRSVCIEEFSYNTDGSIPKIPPTTGGVVKGVKNLNPFDTIQAETICWESGIKTAVCTEGGMMVDSISNGDYIKVEGVDFKDGAKLFEARAASGGSGGSIELRLDSQTGTLVGTCEITGTGGWQTWNTKSCSVTDTKGVHDLFLNFKGGTGRLFTFNWWKFSSPVHTRTGILTTDLFENSITISQNKMLTFKPVIVSEQRQHFCIGLYNLSGRRVTSLFIGDPGQNEYSMDLSGIRSGTYLVKLEQNQTAMTKAINIH